MPLYEYECTACKRHTEKIQKFSDPEITECPFCRAKLERVISAPAVSFKGGGWYKDLYSSARPANGNASESSKEGSQPAAESTKEAVPASTAPVASAAPSASPASSAAPSKE